MAENESFSSRKSVGKAPERSNFTQTCNLLSQYLKEKRSLGDIGFGKPGNLESREKPETFRPPMTTMNFLTNMENPSETGKENGVVESTNAKSVGFLPQFVGFGSSSSINKDFNRADFRKPATMEPETAQMTIFYGGQVLVFNDFPADKAKEIMALAGKGNSNSGGLVSSTPPLEKLESSISNAPESSPVPMPEKNSTHERLQRRPQATDSEMPIARRASLHRFLEKRKDRAAAKAPYQVNHHHASPSKPDEDGQCSNQLDLNL